MTAFAAAIDALFNDPNLGADASYDPVAGSAFSVRAVAYARQPRQDFSPFQTAAVATAYAAEVRASEVAQPAAGDQLVVNGATFRVQSFELDMDKRVWRLDLDRVS